MHLRTSRFAGVFIWGKGFKRLNCNSPCQLFVCSQQVDIPTLKLCQECGL